MPFNPDPPPFGSDQRDEYGAPRATRYNLDKNEPYPITLLDIHTGEYWAVEGELAAGFQELLTASASDPPLPDISGDEWVQLWREGEARRVSEMRRFAFCGAPPTLVGSVSTSEDKDRLVAEGRVDAARLSDAYDTEVPHKFYVVHGKEGGGEYGEVVGALAEEMSARMARAREHASLPPLG